MAPEHYVDAVEHESDSSSTASIPPLSKRQRLKNIGSSAKATTKTLLSIPTASSPKSSKRLDERGDGTATEELTENAAFNTGKVFRRDEATDGSSMAKAKQKIQEGAKTVTHPRDTIKRKAASRVTVRENPYLTPEADAELLSAHRDMEDATASASGTNDDDQSLHVKRKRVVDLEEDRDAMRAAWVTGKHVKRVKVMPRNHVPWPRKSDYRINELVGGQSRFAWEKYLGHMLLYLSQDFTAQYIDDRDEVYFQRDALIRQAERFFIATDGWQSWLMRVRHIYLWEDRWLTFRWLVWYLFLIKTNYMMTFCYGWVLYIVIRNRFQPQSIESLRASHERAMDHGSRAYKISELARRHGNDAWLDPFLDEFGPVLQRQLSDLTDYMEILINFYNWRKPKATLYAVILYSMVCVVCAFTSTDFSLRVWWFVCGLYFFFSRPIGSMYPKYRHVVSNLRWIYWDIPTHPELAFEQLHVQAQSSLAAILKQTQDDQTTADNFPLPSKRISTRLSSLVNIEPPSSSSSSASSSVESFHSATTSIEKPVVNAIDTLYERPVISFRALRFERRRRLRHFVPADRSKNYCQVQWSMSYTRLVEVRKIDTEPLGDRKSTSTTPSTETAPSGGDSSVEDGTSSAQTRTRLKKNISHGSHLLFSHGKKHFSLIPRAALLIEFDDGTTEVVEGMTKRDEAFNSIIGFSGARWMNLPPLAAVHGHREDRQKASVLDETISLHANESHPA